MAAVGQLQQLRRGQVLADTADLFHRAVLVVDALNGQYRAAQARHLGLDVPAAEGRVEPDVIPAPEGRIDVVMVARQPLRQVGAREQLAGALNAAH